MGAMQKYGSGGFVSTTSGSGTAADPYVMRAGTVGKQITVVPTCDTSAYASGDLIADTIEIPNAVSFLGGTAILQSVHIQDESNQGVAFTIYISTASTSFGTINGAPNITAANQRNVVGHVNVATTDYATAINSIKHGQVNNIGLEVQANAASTSLYMAIVNGTGTPTFTASALRIKLSFLQD